MRVGKQYCTRQDVEILVRKLVRKIIGQTVGTGTGGGSDGGIDRFIELNDVPNSYAGEGLHVVRVNAGEDGLEFFEPCIGDLCDVLTGSGFEPVDGDCLVWNAGLSAWVPSFCGGGGSGSGSMGGVCDLADVDCGSPYIPEDNDVIVYDAGTSTWYPLNIDEFFPGLLNYKRIQGRYYGAGIGAPSITTASYGADFLRAVPFIVSRRTTFDRIGLGITAGSGAGRNMRLGIYASKVSDYAYPGALVLDSGQIAVSSNTFFEVNIDQELMPGLYYLAFINSFTFTIRVITAIYAGVAGICGAPDGASNYESYFTVAQAYGALPDPYPAGGAPSSVTTPPNIVLRVK